MNQEAAEALSQFFSAQGRLTRLSVIRSRDYVGDIAKYLCTVIYDMELAERRAAHDGKIGTSRVRVRFNNCPTGHPVRLDEPVEYDEAIVVLGPNSWLRPAGLADDFIFYRFSADAVVRKFKTSGGQLIGGKDTFSQGPDRVLRLSRSA